MAEVGDDSLPVELEDVLVNYGNAVDDLDTYLQPLINANYHTIHAKLDPEERAKLLLTLAYAANSLFWMYLNASGIDPRQHPIKGELDRVKTYFTKLKEATGTETAPRNTQSLDKSAAGRFLKAALNDAGEDVKQKLAEQVRKADAEKASKRKAQQAEDDDDEVEEGQVVEEKVDQLLKQAREKTDATPAAKKRKHDHSTPQTSGKKKSRKG